MNITYISLNNRQEQGGQHWLQCHVGGVEGVVAGDYEHVWAFMVK